MLEKTKREIDASGLGAIVAPLLKWYCENARVLPWRENGEPYRVWVSEIMLQQTQVETVIPYYDRFMQRFPDIESLAGADEDALLKQWEGLGYYSRARNMQKAAKMVLTKFDGRFPEDYDDIRSLPGIGSYTAGAIASICFGQPIPAVDGNVLRVMARLTGSYEDIAEPKVKDRIKGMLGGIYPEGRCGDFTQSLMELGATVCVPYGEPKCVNCPLDFFCRAFQAGEQTALPVKAKKAPRKKEKKTVFLLRCGDCIAIRKRAEGNLLGGLWEFPNAEGHLLRDSAMELLTGWRVSPSSIKEGIRKKHVFTHIEWEMTSYVADCENMSPEFQWVTREKLIGEIALPSAFRAFLNAV